MMNQPFRIVKHLPVETATNSPWLTPDQSILRSGRRRPAAFPLEVLGPWKEWVIDAANGAGAPVDYVAGALLASMAALIGNARSVSPWDSWSEPAVLWIGAVGVPRTGKSPAFDLVLKALRKVEGDLGSDFDDIHLDWATKKEMAKAVEDDWKSKVAIAAKDGKSPPQKPPGAVTPDEPGLPRVLVSDATPEALAGLVVANPKGVLHYRDELTGWLGSFKRYSSGDSRGLWIEAFGARPYVVDRKTSGVLRIPRLAVSVLGGIQPDRLNNVLFGVDDDGLPSRFFWLWPDPLPVKRPTTFASIEFITEAFSRLCFLEPEKNEQWGLRPLTLSLTTDASRAFEEWRVKHFKSHGAVAGILGSAWGKMPGLLLRLSLILELGSWATTKEEAPAQVSLSTINNAIGLMEDYIKPMAERFYGDAALPTAERDAAMLARWLLAKNIDHFNARELRRSAGLPGLRKSQAIDAATSILVDAHWIRPSAPGTGPGRKAKSFDVNPEIKHSKT